MMTWRASKVDDEGKNQQSHDSDKLDGSKTKPEHVSINKQILGFEGLGEGETR